MATDSAPFVASWRVLLLALVIFLSLYTHGQTLCPNMMSNIQKAHCVLIVLDCKNSRERPLPATGIPNFLRAKPKAACEPHCFSLYAKTTSSTKPDIRNVSLRRQRRT